MLHGVADPAMVTYADMKKSLMKYPHELSNVILLESSDRCKYKLALRLEACRDAVAMMKTYKLIG